jgi:selenide,water dikinase
MIRLTETVRKGGCAAKLPAGALRAALGQLHLLKPPQLVVGTETLDDACLWRLGDGRLLVQTLDFFTPIVDDPYDFGAIAAANSLSDVYAMGGSPCIALSILAFPAATLSDEVLGPLLAGAVDKIHEAGACLAGGHTIDDDTLKLGFSVTGFVGEQEAWTNAGARPGDALVLTKALGTGTICSALKAGRARPEWVAGAVKSMTTLNRAPELLRGLPVHAATDVTGFALAGHAMQMAEASAASMRIEVSKLPVLEGALDSIGLECLNRAHHSNRKYAEPHVAGLELVPATLQWMLFDPQTSGGLLLSIPEARADEAIERLRERFPSSRRVGTVSEFRTRSLELVP